MTTTIARYTFLPWLKQGIANKIVEEDNLGANIPATSNMAKERPELTVKLNLNTHEVRKNVKLHGPGDIIGINKDAVLRVHPVSGTQDFESNMLAYMEFYEEDFPWRYTPAIRVDGEKRLRPWFTLVVVKEEEVEFHSDGNGLPYITIKSGFAAKVLPNPTEIWAWAHVHVNHSISQGGVKSYMTNDVKTNPDVAYSRLFCPRRLEKETEGVKYHAFLIPTFETGRLAGLGEDPVDIFAQKSAWTLNGTADSAVRPNDFPVYFNWEFKTGQYGDFETLVKILKAQALGPEFGKRQMNIEEPGLGLDGKANSETLGLEGALKPPSFSRDNWPNGTGDMSFKKKLESILNISQDIQEVSTANNIINPYAESYGNTFYSEKVVDDPIVTPPIYGKWHAMVKRVAETTNSKEWVDELNLDPRCRVAASLGTQTVRKQQEKFMEMAWQQVGEINEANQKIREAELAKWVNNSIHQKHYANLKDDNLLMVTAVAQKTLLIHNQNHTFEDSLTASKIPNAARSAAFKRVIRPGKKTIRNMNMKGKDKENVTRVPIQKSLMSNFNLQDTEGDDLALTAAKTKTKPAMTVTTGDVEDAMRVFLDLQGTAAQENENFRLDQSTVMAQEAFVRNFNVFAGNITNLPKAEPLNPIDHLDVFSTTLSTQLAPFTTIPNLITPLIMTGEVEIEKIKPIMAYPEIPEPMFLYLQNISQDFIIPNIRAIPENTITLLENNQVFIEAYMAGLNHEMSKELLWREYPTDQRGSYFRNFWDDKDSLSSANDTENAHDILPMDDWNNSLGQHNQRIINEGGDEERKKNFVVLVIRGDLLKKYPNTVVFAQKAVSSSPNATRTLADPSNLNNISTPIFQADLEPDIAMYGFNITKDEVVGDGNTSAGWFFVLKERPGQINFGLDESTTIPQQDANHWKEMEWGHLVDTNESLDSLNHIHCVDDDARCTSDLPSWGTNSAEMAYILYQDPVIFARHGEEMLP